MTGAISTGWPDRRRDFERIEIDHFFREEARCFLKKWKHEEDDGKKYYVDAEWNTVYARRAIGSVFTEQNPATYQEYMRIITENPRDYPQKQEYINYRKYLDIVNKYPMESKGHVFNELIKDEFIARPDLFIFVDDQISFLNSIEESCAQSGIPFVGLHCQSYVPKRK
jgi:hypothetical protein